VVPTIFSSRPNSSFSFDTRQKMKLKINLSSHLSRFIKDKILFAGKWVRILSLQFDYLKKWGFQQIFLEKQWRNRTYLYMASFKRILNDFFCSGRNIKYLIHSQKIFSTPANLKMLNTEEYNTFFKSFFFFQETNSFYLKTFLLQHFLSCENHLQKKDDTAFQEKRYKLSISWLIINFHWLNLFDLTPK